MTEVVLATNNQGKVDEFNRMFADLPVTFIPQSTFKLESVAETGLTFVENALIKARYASEHTGLAALADDSGLCIEALNGEPGVHTARYAGEHGDFKSGIQKVLDKMDGIPMEERAASVYCVLVLVRHPKDPAPLICHGSWECLISEVPVGDKGFGYDPIFYFPEYQCTAGEMEPELKNKISHRAQAVEEFLEFLPYSLPREETVR